MVKIYSTLWCPSCVSAKRLLEDNNIDFEEINIETLNMTREDLCEITGGMSVPQIVINDKSIGGFEDLLNIFQSGELMKLVNKWN